jgi:outer membrane protein assembly factor BamB
MAMQEIRSTHHTMHLAMLAACAIVFGTGYGVESRAAQPLAKKILAVSRVKAGLCVGLGVTDGALLAELGKTDQFVVHGLVTSSTDLKKVRDQIRAQGFYGKVSVEHGSLASLPYADHLANLIVVNNLPSALSQGLTLSEVIRVLAYNGTAWIGAATGLTADELKVALATAGIKKFRIVSDSGVWAVVKGSLPEGADEWTHSNYGPEGNRVSNDRVAGPPERLQWIGGVPWPMPDYKAKGMVVGGGRMFCAINEHSVRKNSWLYLSARDAFSGVLLWKRPAPGFSAVSTVVSGDRLYTVLKAKSSLVALDAATGALIKTYAEATSPGWVVLYKGNLLVSVSRQLKCLDPETGKVRWKNAKRLFDGRGGFTNIALDGDELYFTEHGRGTLGCLDLATGQEKWHREISQDIGGEKRSQLSSYQKGVIILGGGKGVHAFSAKDGKHLWTHSYEIIGSPSRRKAKSFSDGFFINDHYWILVGDIDPRVPPKYKYLKNRKFSWQGLDPLTGDVKKVFPLNKAAGASCHRDQATVNYFMGGYSDFVETKTGKERSRAKGLHSSCSIGVRIAYGMTYNSALYMPGRFLQGEMAVTTADPKAVPLPDDKRLEKGPAYGAKLADSSSKGTNDWPSYGQNALHNNRTSTAVPSELKLLWTKPLGKILTAPTVANGMVFVADSDRHQVMAFNANDGTRRWTYTADAPVKIPPTYDNGLCLFGASDGRVYCLRASDGKLVWRFQAARTPRRIVGHERVESTWPIETGVIVNDGLAYFVAGRHGQVDGGVDVYAVESRTGRVEWHSVAKGGGSTSMLVCDGTAVFLWSRRTRFPLRAKGQRPPSAQYPAAAYSADLLELTYAIGYKEKGPGMWATLPVRAQAMVRAGDTVFVSGQLDSDRKDGLQIKWIKGRRGPAGTRDIPHKHPLDTSKSDEPKYHLWSFSAQGGKKLTELQLPSAPVFDGMAAAGGRLFLTTQKGELLCFGGK